MVQIPIQKVLDVTNGVFSGAKKDVFLPVPCIDSRKMSSNSFFVAIQGDNFDGHDFVEQAFTTGAQGALVRQKAFRKEWRQSDAWTIEVEDTLKAFHSIANLIRRSAKAKVIAITGSSGKTTTKDICASILEKMGTVLKTHENLNNFIGVPLTLVRLRADHDFAVIEVGMNRSGEIGALTNICEPDVGLINNVNSSHMEFFSSVEEIACAKSELIENLPEGNPVVLNGDDAFFSFMRKKTRGNIVSFGLGKNLDVRGENLVWDLPEGLKFDLLIEGERRECSVPLHGKHNIYNALGAATVAFTLGCSIDTIVEGITDAQISPMRSRLIKINGYNLYLDAYNASPSSTTAAVEYIHGMAKKRPSLIVLGDMLELGKISHEAHKKTCEQVLYGHTNLFITYGPLYKKIYDTMKSCYAGQTLYYHCESYEEIASLIKNNIREGDWLLIKGSRRMKMEKVAVELGVDLEQGNVCN